MGLINIFKPQSALLSPAPPINLDIIKLIFWNAKNQAPGHRVRSKNVNSVLCSPTLLFEICFQFNPISAHLTTKKNSTNWYPSKHFTIFSLKWPWYCFSLWSRKLLSPKQDLSGLGSGVNTVNHFLMASRTFSVNTLAHLNSTVMTLPNSL